MNESDKQTNDKVKISPYTLTEFLAKYDALTNEYKEMAKDYERLKDLEGLVEDFVNGDAGITPEEQLATIKKVVKQSAEEYEKECGHITVSFTYENPNIFIGKKKVTEVTQ